jgi:hypothetical protein
MAVVHADRAGPPVSIAGVYTLTFIADGVCAAAVPVDLRTRTYATRAETRGDFNSRLSKTACAR